MNHVNLKTVSLKSHPELNEAWIQNIIKEDPSLLGLGDVIVKDFERNQRGAGRLDLLLQDADNNERYEVEIQLGTTDESHIIRTIEYWDIERKKYPQYDHTAVIVAEDITSRFFNVISLFNGHIPLKAIQVSCIEIDKDNVSLNFTTILDTVHLGLIDDDEVVSELTDRNYWLNRASKKTISGTDTILKICHEFCPELILNYNKHYIGFIYKEHAFNIATITPKKKHIRLEIKLKQNAEIDSLIEESDILFINYDKRWGAYKFKVTNDSIDKNRELLLNLLKQAYDLRMS